jgi:acyl carrier protein
MNGPRLNIIPCEMFVESIIAKIFDIIQSGEIIHLECEGMDDLKDVRLTDLGFDSLSLMRLLICMEHEFGMDCESDVIPIASLTTINNIAIYLNEHYHFAEESSLVK